MQNECVYLYSSVPLLRGHMKLENRLGARKYCLVFTELRTVILELICQIDLKRCYMNKIYNSNAEIITDL